MGKFNWLVEIGQDGLLDLFPRCIWTRFRSPIQNVRFEKGVLTANPFVTELCPCSEMCLINRSLQHWCRQSKSTEYTDFQSYFAARCHSFHFPQLKKNAMSFSSQNIQLYCLKGSMRVNLPFFNCHWMSWIWSCYCHRLCGLCRCDSPGLPSDKDKAISNLLPPPWLP
jgi:hypothetical protein